MNTFEFDDSIFTEEDFNIWFAGCAKSCKTFKEFVDRIGYIIEDEYTIKCYISGYLNCDTDSLLNEDAETLCFKYLLHFLSIES